MNVDIPQKPFTSPKFKGNPALVPGFVWPNLVGSPGPAGSDNGKPKSYEPFWALSRVGVFEPIRNGDTEQPSDLRFWSSTDETVSSSARARVAPIADFATTRRNWRWRRVGSR